MIIKYDEYIKESLSTKTDIKNWLDKMNIENYTINDDLTVDVVGVVDIIDRNLSKIPVRFNKVNGDFFCTDNNLTSLEGCPIIINGDLDCSNNKLTNLKYCSSNISGNFFCYDNYLTSLEGCPNIVNGDFYCSINNLTSLEGCPNIVNGDFYCYENIITSLKGCPTIINGRFFCYKNPLVDINDLDSTILIKNINSIEVSEEVFDKYFEYWIDKDSNILSVLKDKVSDNIKQKYSHLFQANNFDLL